MPIPPIQPEHQPPDIAEPTCEPPSNSAQPIADRVVFYQGAPTPASEAPIAEEVYSGEEVVQKVYAEGPPIFKDPRAHGHQLPPHMRRVTALWGMAAGTRRNQPKVSRPTNADSVGPAGKAVLDAYLHSPKGRVMDINAADLKARMERLEYLQSCRRAVTPMVGQFDDAIALELVEIDKAVRKGLKDVAGLVESDADLAEALTAALLHVRGPAEQAVVTRQLVNKAFQAGLAQGHAEAKAEAEAAARTPPPRPEK